MKPAADPPLPEEDKSSAPNPEVSLAPNSVMAVDGKEGLGSAAIKADAAAASVVPDPGVATAAGDLGNNGAAVTAAATAAPSARDINLHAPDIR